MHRDPMRCDAGSERQDRKADGEHVAPELADVERVRNQGTHRTLHASTSARVLALWMQS